MFVRIVIAAGFVFYGTTTASAQQATNGSNGEGILFVSVPLSALMNVKSDDVSFKFSFLRRQTAHPLAWGFDIGGKLASGGLFNLVKSGDVSPGFKINGNVGWTHLTTSRKSGGNVDWIYAQASYDLSETVLFRPSAPFAEQLSTDTFRAPGIKFGYSYSWQGALLFGVATGGLASGQLSRPT